VLARDLPRQEIKGLTFEPYAADFGAGVPLLRSETPGRELLLGAADAFAALTAALTGAPIPETLAAKTRELNDDIRKTPDRAREVFLSLVMAPEDAPAVQHSGAARYIAWTALTHALGTTLEAYKAWRQGAEWLRGYCPTCGARPLLSALTKADEGRRRSLHCGLCATQWNVKRLGCPHCGTEDEDKLAILEIDAVPDLRLDVCDNCRGYLKTWAGQGEIAPYFSDWATLHLDAMAAERGYARLGDSLYEIP
jgi:FdhE protein